MEPKFKVGDIVRHTVFDISYTVENIIRGQAQFFYDLRQDENTLVEKVPEHELELSN